MALIRQFVRTRDGALAPSLVRPRSWWTRDGAAAPSLVCQGPRTSAAQACGRGRLRGRVTFAEAKTTAEASMFPDMCCHKTFFLQNFEAIWWRVCYELGNPIYF